MPHVTPTTDVTNIRWSTDAPAINVREGAEVWIEPEVWESDDFDQTHFEVVEPAGADPDTSWLKDDLVAYAEDHGIDASGTKADILERIQEADT